MLKSTVAKLMLIMLFVVAGGAAWAAVYSEAVNGSAARDALVVIPLKFTSTSNTNCAGINGELVFDPALFSNPTIISGLGSNSSFIALGNLASAGHYKFVVYSDPTKSFDRTQPVAFFQFKVAKTISKSTTAALTYANAASGDVNAGSLTTSFATVNLKLQGNGASDWALYD